jgi:hypothetical protein
MILDYKGEVVDLGFGIWWMWLTSSSPYKPVGS